MKGERDHHRNIKANDNIFSNVIVSNVFIAFFLAALSSYSIPLRGIPNDVQVYFKLANNYHVISWILFLNLQHYFTISAWSFSRKLIAGALYGSILIFLIDCFYSATVGALFWTWAISVLYVWVLMADFPILWRKEIAMEI
ncbi:MAG: hypothetical protein FWH52_02545 [Synergistaceae bacterium]|nr:hypothetical protein [Synergistaceae bacterium]